MLVDIKTSQGLRKIRVCDNCKTICIPSGRFCSGFCSRAWSENMALKRNEEKTVIQITRVSE